MGSDSSMTRKITESVTATAELGALEAIVVPTMLGGVVSMLTDEPSVASVTGLPVLPARSVYSMRNATGF